MFFLQKVPQRTRILMLVILHDKLMTNKERYRRGIAPNPFCLCCQSEVEDLNHLFRYCTKVRPLWPQIMGNHLWCQAQGSSFRDWFAWNMKTNKVTGITRAWKDQFSMCLWWIWRWQNDYIFKNMRPDMLNKVSMLKNSIREVNSVFSNQVIM